MIFDQFQESLAAPNPPKGLPGVLKALWLDANGDWKGAHAAIQAESGEEAAWVHAYLHRKEGDLSNADYWYRRAERDRPVGSLEDEWASLATHFTDR